MANRLRDSSKERYWRGVLKQFASSGLSVRAFCRSERLAESAFYAWRRTIAQRDAETERSAKAPHAPTRPAQTPAFLPLVVNGSIPLPATITLELAGGRVLRLPEAIAPARLAEIIAALEAQVSPAAEARP